MIETDANTVALINRRKQDEIDEAVKQALEKDHEPYKAYKKQAIIVFVTVVTGAIVTGAWKLILFVAELDNLIQGVK